MKKLKFIYRLDGSIILILFMLMQARILGFLLSTIKYLYGDVSDHWVKTIDLQYVGNNWNLFWRRFISSSSTDTFIYQSTYVSAFQKLTLNITFPIILSYILFHIIYLYRQIKNYLKLSQYLSQFILTETTTTSCIISQLFYQKSKKKSKEIFLPYLFYPLDRFKNLSYIRPYKKKLEREREIRAESLKVSKRIEERGYTWAREVQRTLCRVEFHDNGESFRGRYSHANVKCNNTGEDRGFCIPGVRISWIIARYCESLLWFTTMGSFIVLQVLDCPEMSMAFGWYSVT